MQHVPQSGPRDWLVRARRLIGVVSSLLRPLTRSRWTGRTGFRGLLVIAAAVGLGGCAGGFQGSRPEALTSPTLTGPVSQTVMVGQTATFSVTAGGSGPLSYQWYKNGILISGATSSTYTTPATVAGDNGTVFTVVASNPAGKLDEWSGDIDSDESGAFGEEHCSQQRDASL